MNTSYTPGPWRQEGSIVRAGDFAIRLGVKIGKPQTEWDANARLIAAAPELLEALKEIAAVYAVSHRDSTLAVAWSAIDKAEGR